MDNKHGVCTVTVDVFITRAQLCYRRKRRLQASVSLSGCFLTEVAANYSGKMDPWAETCTKTGLKNRLFTVVPDGRKHWHTYMEVLSGWSFFLHRFSLRIKFPPIDWGPTMFCMDEGFFVVLFFDRRRFMDWQERRDLEFLVWHSGNLPCWTEFHCLKWIPNWRRYEAMAGYCLFTESVSISEIPNIFVSVISGFIVFFFFYPLDCVSGLLFLNEDTAAKR